MKPLSVDTQGILGVIHARGGSKRIPLKNMKLLAGRPLISYLVEAAMESRLLDRLIVSTDHPEIGRIAREYGAEVPFVRPAELAEAGWARARIVTPEILRPRADIVAGDAGSRAGPNDNHSRRKSRD